MSTNYSQTQLEVIRIFGRKELTEGLYFRKENVLYKIPKCICIGDGIIGDAISGSYGHTISYKIDSVEILGHIPHLEDLFRVAEEKELDLEILVSPDRTYWISISDRKGTKNLFVYNPTIPLLEQEETLTKLISLFK